ncbi:MAG TPA: helix-turn-helix transcriptional regulator [Bacteroidales bacterium]|nr:helix-turn-helix transcriptional regulator [Bacteroidales bacterium]HSA42333.1 helix-turn-helix transcriptional regulator [Bacteroidales bacterium]
MDTNLVGFENRIKFLLGIKKMTIRELCEKIGMSDVNLYRRFKAGSIETKHLEKIAEVLGVHPGYFFGSELERITENERRELILMRAQVSQLEKQAKSWEDIANKYVEQAAYNRSIADLWIKHANDIEKMVVELRKEVAELRKIKSV